MSSPDVVAACCRRCTVDRALVDGAARHHQLRDDPGYAMWQTKQSPGESDGANRSQKNYAAQPPRLCFRWSHEDTADEGTINDRQAKMRPKCLQILIVAQGDRSLTVRITAQAQQRRE